MLLAVKLHEKNPKDYDVSYKIIFPFMWGLAEMNETSKYSMLTGYVVERDDSP
jgi:hypothetical protein